MGSAESLPSAGGALVAASLSSCAVLSALRTQLTKQTSSARQFPLADLSDEIALAVGRFLDARSLQALGQVCKRLARKAPPVIQNGVIVESLSLVHEAARLRWRAHSAEQQRRVHRLGQESWLLLLRRLEAISSPVVFQRSYRGTAEPTLSDNGRTLTKGRGSSSTTPAPGMRREGAGLLDAWLAWSVPDRRKDGGEAEIAREKKPVTMRSGCHYAEFSGVRSRPGEPHFCIGVVDNASVRRFHQESGGFSPRPSAEPPSGGGRTRDAAAYLYDTREGTCLDWTGVDWARHRWAQHWPHGNGGNATVGTDHIGLMLDVDKGTLSLYKNGWQVGTMVRDLSRNGEYVWVVLVERTGDSVHIDGPKPVPRSFKK